MPALDGLRGVFVVLGPLLYHARPESIRGGPDILPGGILSLDLFFVLSSFLITSIALREWDQTGRIDLVAYAGRRARRLLPALFTALIGVTAYLVLAGDPQIVPRWTGAIVSALTYSANWHEIAAGVSYFEQFDNPSPLKHVWSFAIEEQFYVFAPLFVIAGLRGLRGRGHQVLFGVAVAGAVASAMWMARLHVPGQDPSRVYYGTDTRAQALFVGIALALAVRMYGTPKGPTAQKVLRYATYPATAVFVWMIATVSHQDDWMFERGGFLLVAVTSMVIIFGMAQPAGRHNPLQQFFEWRPVRYSGRISYGLYLYHWPIYLLFTGERAGALFGRTRLDGYELLAFHLVLTFAVAIASFHLIEQPVMQRRWPVIKRPVTLAVGAFVGAVAVVMILAGLLLANSTRPVRVEQILVPMAAPATNQSPAQAAGNDTGPGGFGDSASSPDTQSQLTGEDVAGGGTGAQPQDGSQTSDGSGLQAGDATPGDNQATSLDPATAAGDVSGDGSGDAPGDGSNVADGGSAGGGQGTAATGDDHRPGGSQASDGNELEGSGTADTGEPGQPPARTGPVRVLVVGDSVSAQIGWALHDWSVENPGEIIVYNESHIGCGVVRHGLKFVPGDEGGPVGEVCSNWAVPVDFTEVADSEIVSWPTALEVFAPDAVVAHVSPWDATDRIVPGVVEEWTSVGDPAYDAYALAEYTAATEMLTSTGATLYWLEGPVLNRELVAEDHTERIADLNRIAREAAMSAQQEGHRVVMVDFPAFVGPIGSDRELTIRNDGVHLSEQGQQEVAPWLVDLLTATTARQGPIP